jgi:hypothetical protein
LPESKPKAQQQQGQVKPQTPEEPKESLWSVDKVGNFLFVASQFGAIYRVEYYSFTQIDGKRVRDASLFTRA